MSFAGGDAPSRYLKKVFTSMPWVRNHQFGISQPLVDPASAKLMDRPRASSGKRSIFRSGLAMMIAL